MSGNTFGNIFKVTTFGESHGHALGCIIDGCPPNLEIDESDIQIELNRRKPGQSDVTTQRKEDDSVQILSGVFEGKTLGTPISLLIFNKDQQSKDYSNIKDSFRPNHADITYQAKYGHRDYRGGGRSSARETAMRVAAGAIAKKYLSQYDVKTTGYVSQIGNISAESITLESANKNKYFFGDMSKIEALNTMFDELIAEGNSVGAKLGVCVENCPVGLGEPVFDKLNADLAKAIMSINAVKSVSIGNAENILNLKGSEIRDEIRSDGFASNNAGGILGGISNGDNIELDFLIKPTSSIKKKGKTVDKDGNEVDIEVIGRHDPCVGIRAVPIAEAMVNLVIMDHLLRNRAQCGEVEQKLPFTK
ncbi:chorismate synthase [Gammaproteobacteria bacterium]|nr:chorismate synthase [Gammaproteobacteria bacterium]